MKRFKLEQVGASHLATMSVLIDSADGLPVGIVTLERPWKENKPFESCSPGNVYIVKRYISEKYPKEKLAWEVQDVTGRTRMLWHSGNKVENSKGCTLPGLKFVKPNGIPEVRDSRIALKLLAQITNEEDFALEIVRKF